MTAAEQTETEVPEKEDSGSDSSSVSPVKKAKMSKGMIHCEAIVMKIII